MSSISKRFSFLRRDKDKKRQSGSWAESSTNGVANGSANGVASHAATSQPDTKKTAGEASGRYPDPPDHGKEQLSLQGALNAFAGLYEHSMRPMPESTGDGTYLVEDEVHASKFQDLKTIGFKDVKTLLDQIENGSGPIDDKTMLMERVIQLVADLPANSMTRSKLTNGFVDQLFNSLQHPPLSYLTDKFKYRQADGSYNNVLYPHLGAANTPYARTVQPEKVQPGALPDPGVIFDSLFAREEFRPHPNNNSSIIFYWAAIIIHDLFQTDHHDFGMSQTSSYLDLSPLYGDVQEDQDQIRTFKDGMLKPDCFSEHRLLTFPPGCGVILIMFNRFHNYVAEQLALINENGRFTKPKEDAPEKAWKKYDEDLFQTARLVTGGLYMNITLCDYVRTIINLNRSNTTWTLDPRVKENNTAYDPDGTPRGIGNQVSVEFNLVYRWHSAISDRDDKWTQGLFKHLFGKEAKDVSMQELLAGMVKYEAEMPEDPLQRNFNNLKRGDDGKFNDDDLVEIITSSIEDVAGRSGANHIPKSLRSVTILGIIQARQWECASLNEFRKFFGLKEHRSFQDVNKNPKVAEQLMNLYEHPDYVELYTGLVAEDEKQPMSEEEGGPVGVGICPTYTVSRAILSDAVALVRGDRFYTIDYTPRNLTNWGFSEVAYDFNVEQGCCFSKLFLRAFPQHFLPNSIYAHQPMTTPAENRKIMQKLGRESHYSWERPKRQPGRIMIQNYHGVRQVLENAKKFSITWGDGFGYVMGERARKFMLSGDGEFFTAQKKEMHDALYLKDWHKKIRDFYTDITLKLIKKWSKKILAGKGQYINQVDITRDIGNLAHVHFAAGVFSLPLKTDEHPRGIYTEHELYLVLALMFVFIFFDVDPVKTFPLALASYETTHQLGKLVEAEVSWISKTAILSGITDRFMEDTGPLAEYGVHLIRHLLEQGKNAEDITWAQIVPTAGAMCANQAQIFTQVLDFYLLGDGKKHWPEIVATAKSTAPDADDKILHYIMEGMRLNGTYGSYRRAEVEETITDTGYTGTTTVKPGDKVFVSFVKASRDPEIFPNPDDVRLDRPLDKYLNYGAGPHECLGRDISRVSQTAMLRTIASKLENLRPAPGGQGQLKKVPRGDGFYAYMTEDQGRYFPFPTTWKLHFDGEIPSS